ncbi:MAG: hypothetical protein R3C59_00310 [Planctomycetaceae bacterium]
MKRQASLSLTLLSLTVMACGCGDSSPPAPVPVMTDNHDHGHDHDHGHGEHGHPETIGAALHAVSDVRDQVRDAAKDGNPEAAHGALHDVFAAIEAIGTLAEKAELSDEAKATIKTNVEVLLDNFGEVDTRLHKPDEGSEYKDVAEKIDAALKAITDAAGPLAAHEDHDEHHDHADGHKDGDHNEHEDAHDDHKEADAGKKE